MFIAYFLSFDGLQDTVSLLPYSGVSYSITDNPQDLGWLTGDLIAGITVGIVLVPQGMSYATVSTI